ncbi:MAG: ABC transporter ATP-binding protein/permease [Candidatus Helarchaeota archaeon]|nr:ABC transporter ATP-binding protein/permease [Candidatus Helarchaeota archaeon]
MAPSTRLVKSDIVEFSPEKDQYKKAREKSPGRWIVAHILKGSNKFLFFFTFLTTILSAVLSSGVIVIIGYAITDILAAGTIATLINYVWIILFMGIGSPLLILLNNLIRETLAQRIERDTRKEFYMNLLGKSQSFHDLQRIGNLMALATNDIRMLNFLISPALSLIINAFTSLIVPIVFIALFYPTQLVITPIAFCLLFIITLRDYLKKIGPITVKLQNYFGELEATLTETLSGIEVVKANALELREIKKYLAHAGNYRDAYAAEGLAMGKYLPLLIVAVAITIGFCHSILLNLQGLMVIGQIIAYIGLLTQLRFPTNISIFAFASVRLAIAGAERILKIMNATTTIDQNIGGISKKITGTVKFENVSFTYPNTDIPVLQNISFEIKAGQTVAIVGTTGSGKTTLTKLLSRLYDVSDGKILIDDIDTREYALQSLRSQISRIEQDIFLFSSSIFDNISFGRVSSLEEVINVAKKAQVHEFVDKMPKKYDSTIGERGVQLSGGEKQRIAIARAFLTAPAILILDDSTSAIDSNTEDSIQRAMNEIRQNRTTFLITHRLSQIRWADLILVLRHGRIVAKGTHEELLETSDEYRKIFVKRFDVDVTQLKEVR